MNSVLTRISKVILFILMLVMPLAVCNDFSHHTHNIRLYNEMIKNREFRLYDPYYQAKQVVVFYGIPVYLLGGILYNIFGIYTLPVMLEMIVIFSFLGLRKIAGGNKAYFLMMILFSTLSSNALIFPPTMVLFWCIILLYRRKNKYYFVPLILSAMNHPYGMIGALFFIFKRKKNFLWYLPLSFFYFYMYQYTKHYSPIGIMSTILIYRTLLMFAPLLEGMRLPIFNEKVGALFFFSWIAFCPAVYYVWFNLRYLNQGYGFFYSDPISGIPAPNGSIVRVLDRLSSPVDIYIFEHDFKKEQGSFFELDNTKPIVGFHEWENFDEYNLYLEEKNVSHILLAKYYFPKSNEISFLVNNFNIVWENEYYYLYKKG